MYQGKSTALRSWIEPELQPAAMVGVQTPMGEMFVAASDDHIVSCGFEEGHFLEELASIGYEAVVMGAAPRATRLAKDASGQIEHYFAGGLRSFDLPIDLNATTPFAQAVLRQVATGIPFGGTATYGEVGEHAGHTRAARAVGNILAACPFSVIVPCHRVVHAARPFQESRPRTGQARRKEWLLTFEREVLDGKVGS